LFGSGILLIGILFSGAFRSWLRVFVSKHFYNYNYDYREEWKRFTRSLSEEGTEDLAVRAVQALASLVESPGGAAFVSREAGNFESIANWNMSASSESDVENSSLQHFLEQKQWVIDLQEYQAFPGRYDYLAIPSWLLSVPRGWLIIPLILHGKLRGMVVLAQPRSAIKLNWEITDLLKIAGSQAASYLAQRESAAALSVARQFESFNRMSTFVVHDIKNLVSQLSLLISNAEKHRHNPEFQEDMIDTINYSVQKMKLLLQKLSRRDSVEKKMPLRIDELLQQAVNAKSSGGLKPVLQIVDAGLIVYADWDRLERVIGHIIQNGIEATPKDGKVTISIAKGDKHAAISIVDTGHGMSQEFIRDRLFRPFDSTKSAGMGIGVFESREYIHELGGDIEVISQESKGTSFHITLPLHNVDVERLQEEASEPE
jgi:putative PEP-CTERM system histidine kinase